MPKRKCDHFTPQDGHCRKDARVRVRFRLLTEDGNGSSQYLYRCWEHHVKLENKARENKATFVIEHARVLP